MSDQSLYYVVPSAAHLLGKIKDTMVSAGWTLVGPSSSPASHDDPNGHILGWFLHSTGEDGEKDMTIHLGLNSGFIGYSYASYAYLTSGIGDSDTTIPVSSGGTFAAGNYICLENEIIYVGGVSSNNLTSCVRGYGLSTKVSHSSGSVVLLLQNSTTYAMPVIEIYGFSDYSTPVAASSASASFGVSSVSAVTGLTDYGIDKLRYHSLVKISGGTEDGKMRWVTDYTTGTGALSYQPYLTAPGTANCHIISGGFSPTCSRRWVNADSYLKGMCVIGGTNRLVDVGYASYIYANKDRVFVYVPHTTAADVGCQYAGAVSPLKSSYNTVTSGSLSAGATSIVVDDASLFCKNMPLRVFSQSASDWVSNWDRSAEAPAGSWSNLDVEELPSEQIFVTDVDYDTNTLSLSSGLIYSYAAGALIGENPRLVCSNLPRYGLINNNTNPRKMTFNLNYYDVPYTSWASHASHRGCYRSFHADGNRYTALTNYSHDSSHHGVAALGPVGEIAQEDNQVSGTFNLNRVALVQSTTGIYLFEKYGRFRYHSGYLKGVYAFYGATAPFSGVAQVGDTCKALWRGSYKTFRIFKFDDSGTVSWYCVGPES